MRCFFAVLALIICNIQFVSAAPFQSGSAVVDITPPVGYRMSGYFYERLNEGVKDPLKAKAIVFSQGDTKAALVFCDLIGISLEISTAARKQIASQLNIPIANVSISATHSHTGPLYAGSLRNKFHDNAIMKTGTDAVEKTNYPEYLSKQIVKATRLALENVKTVRFSAGYGHEDRVAFNRRFHMKTGKVRFNPGVLNPNIIRAAGPIDPEIGIILFRSAEDNKPLSSLMSYALHLDTVGGTKYSADYPYYLQKTLSEIYGDDFISLFGIGTCGDINHVDVTKRHRLKTVEIGAALSESVSKTLPKLTHIEEPTLAVKSAIYHAPKQQFSPERIKQAEADMDRIGDRKVPFLKRVETNKIVAVQLYPGETIPIEVHVIRLSSDVAIVTLPGEVFVDLGIEIKQNSPFKSTLVIELANAAPGYIPTRKAFAEGSYETVNSRAVPGTGEEMVKLATKLLNEIHEK